MITQSQNIAKQTVLTPILTSILYLLSPIGTQRQIFEKPRNELIVLPDFEFQLLTWEVWSAFTVTHLKTELVTLFHNNLLFHVVHIITKPNLWIALKLLK